MATCRRQLNYQSDLTNRAMTPFQPRFRWRRIGSPLQPSKVSKKSLLPCSSSDSAKARQICTTLPSLRNNNARSAADSSTSAYATANAAKPPNAANPPNAAKPPNTTKPANAAEPSNSANAADSTTDTTNTNERQSDNSANASKTADATADYEVLLVFKASVARQVPSSGVYHKECQQHR
ncbi:hypothetical protein ACLOJK_029618 [Asimina triloba]